MTSKRRITSPADVCVTNLVDIQIVTATPDYTGDMANIYARNPQYEEDEDVYIGELCDPRLLALVRKAPKLAEFIHFLHTTAVLDPDYDQEWVEFVAELNEQLGM